MTNKIAIFIMLSILSVLMIISCQKDDNTNDQPIVYVYKPMFMADMEGIERAVSLQSWDRALAKQILFLGSLTMDNAPISTNKQWHKLNGHKLIKIVLNDSGEGIVNFGGGVILRAYNVSFYWTDGTITTLNVLSYDRGLSYVHELANNSKGYLHVNHAAKIVRYTRESGISQTFFNVDRDQNGSTSKYKIDYSLNGSTYNFKTRLDLQPNSSASNLFIINHQY